LKITVDAVFIDARRSKPVFRSSYPRRNTGGKSMSRLLGVVGIYSLMFLGWTGVGIFMVIAPASFGNAIHESFGLFPSVGPRNSGKKLLVRIAGIALLGFAARFALGVSRMLR
jgi:hypothetical protein